MNLTSYITDKATPIGCHINSASLIGSNVSTNCWVTDLKDSIAVKSMPIESSLINSFSTNRQGFLNNVYVICKSISGIPIDIRAAL